MNHSLAATAARFSLVLASTASLGLAQLPQSDAPPQSPVGLLKSPGMPRIYWGQTTRFTSAWNPAAGIAFDGAFSWADDGEEDMAEEDDTRDVEDVGGCLDEKGEDDVHARHAREEAQRAEDAQ